MISRILVSLALLTGLLLAGCGSLVEPDLLVFQTADPHIRVGFRLLPGPDATPTRDDTECLIKGNISSTGEKIYHLPGSASYGQTVIDPSRGEMWLCSEAAAVDAGFRKALR